MEPIESVETKPTPAPQASNTGVILTVFLALAVVGAGGFALRHELLTKMTVELTQQQDVLTKLTQKVSALESQTASLAALPRPDTNAIETMHSDLTAAQATIAQMTERMTQLEKKPVEAPKPLATEPEVKVTRTTDNPLVAYIKSGSPYQSELAAWDKGHAALHDKIPALRAAAPTGIATDEQLRGQFRTLLDQLSAPMTPAADNGIVSRINTHLAGLVTIKKTSPVQPELATLRTMGDMTTIQALAQHVEQLPATLKPTFTVWLATVRARDAALAELSVLDGAQ